MKNNFLTIPDAPNYEINSELVVRNKKTGKILKPYFHNGYSMVSLYANGEMLRRSPIACWKCAKTSLDKSLFSPVPSLNNLYEFSKSGILRHVQSKKIVNPNSSDCFQVYIDGKRRSISRHSLLYEVFGNSRGKPRVQMFLSNGNRRHHFDTAADAARFLSPIIHYSFPTISGYFSRRLKLIHGWRVNYINDLS